MRIYVDADACPVKEEIYRVARRIGIPVTLVADQPMRTPGDAPVTMQVVDSAPDAADDWIVEHVSEGDVVVTADIPLAARCVSGGAHVLSPTGKIWTEDNVGDALATRDLMTDLREIGQITGGPRPFSQKDRSEFLQRLDQVIQKELRRRG